MNIPERISALRALMEERGYDVYMVPTDDFHQSEYVGDHFKVREYITGFTGSAGTAVFTKDEAGLWTDGRYLLLLHYLKVVHSDSTDVSLPSKRELHWKKPLLLKMPRSTIPKILSEKYGQTVLRFLKSRLSHSAKNTQVKVQRANLHVSVRL